MLQGTISLSVTGIRLYWLARSVFTLAFLSGICAAIRCSMTAAALSISGHGPSLFGSGRSRISPGIGVGARNIATDILGRPCGAVQDVLQAFQPVIGIWQKKSSPAPSWTGQLSGRRFWISIHTIISKRAASAPGPGLGKINVRPESSGRSRSTRR